MEQRVFHPSESELDFSEPSNDEQGPYSDYPTFFNTIDDILDGWSRHTERESLPVKFMNLDGLMIDSTLEEVEQIEGMEAYGWYNPKGNHNEK